MAKERVASIYNLLRRAFGPPDKRFLNPDGSATSRVFKLRDKDNGELSVNVKEMTTIEGTINDPQKFVLFEISVIAVETLGLSAHHDPLNEKDHGFSNPAHAYIWGLDINDDVKPGLLARASRRVHI